MLIGTMNHPQHDLFDEIRWMADLGMDFIDLTLEPPAAASWRTDPEKVRSALERHGLAVVGHTAYYLPMASPFEEVRQGAVTELIRCLHCFSRVGARWMNLHPDRNIPMHTRDFWVQQNLKTIRELLPVAREVGVGLMIENLPEAYNSPATLGSFLDAVPELGLHLDIGHANLLVAANTTEAILAAYGSRLRHVHLHDNKGGSADLHLPLGGGTMDYARQLRAVKHAGYDGPITLEIFTPDKHYMTYSRDLLRRLWPEL